MTSRERILNTLRGKKVDRIPWLPVCTRTFFLSLPEYQKKFPYKWWNEDGGISEELIEEELTFRIDFYKNIGIDFMQWGGKSVNIKRNVKIKRQKKDNELIVKYETPEGNLEETFTFSEESQTPYRKTYLLKSEKDFKVYKYILENTKVKKNFSSVENQLKIIGENGVIFAGEEVFPPMHFYVNDSLGIENLVFFLLDKNKELEELLEIQENIVIETTSLLTESPLEIFLHGATWDIGRISPKIYEKYYLPCFKRYNRILHEKGKICLDHLSGQRIKPFLGLIEHGEFDGIYGFVFPSLKGDIPLKELVKRWKEKKIIPMGGLDPNFLAVSKPDEIKNRVKRLIEEVGDKPFILGTSDDVVYGTPLKNLEAVSEALTS